MHALIGAAVLLATIAGPVAAQSSPPPEALKDLAPTGKLRAAINFGNGVLAQKGPNGEPRGVSAELAAALAKKLGVPLEYVRFEAAGKVFEALAKREVDVGFIAIEPKRAAEVTFSPPYVLIEGTYMVRKDSPLKDVEDVDKPGIRIASASLRCTTSISRARSSTRRWCAPRSAARRPAFRCFSSRSSTLPPACASRSTIT